MLLLSDEWLKAILLISMVTNRNQEVQYLVHLDLDLSHMDEQIELRHLRYFVAVAQELHFGRAAQKLHIAQPPLSQQIRRLEEIVGCALFQRTSRSVKLTLAGEALLASAQRTLARVREDLDRVRSIARGEVGSLSVGFVSSAMLTPFPSALSTYREMYPQVRLQLHEFHTSQLMEAIRKGDIDVGLVRDPGSMPDVHSEPVVTESLIVLFPKGHLLARYRVVPVEKLKNEPFVFYPRSAGEFAWEATMQFCEKRGFRPRIAQEAPHWQTIVGLVAAGIGITIAPACVATILPADAEYRPLRPKGATEIHLAWGQNPANALLISFCAIARESFAAHNRQVAN
jgi:DNA-binding transcriptional LysR family regulator